MNNLQKQTQITPKPAPAWMTFVSRADETSPWLRLMIVNPVNGAMSITLFEPIEVDPPDFGPTANDLPTA